ncbi:uncharacterized protein BDV17DRAFT_301091 [Aspergillus undulatus]|uniref:uncharacterized protein n=1 Tax=Aspergillus undulatus TaxID=1810928 RepID=UPI003CCDC48D
MPSPADGNTDIRVIVVGAGFAGLSTAISCHLSGLSVTIYERFPTLQSLGDIISFGRNAGTIFARWGDVVDRMLPASINLQNHGFRIHKYTGEHVTTQKSVPFDRNRPTINGHRGELHGILFGFAREIGVSIRLGCEVVDVFEGGNGDGHVYGDVVIACDGIRSKTRQAVLGYEPKLESSGYAIYRAWFSNEAILADPLTKHLCENGDTFNGWIGPDVHLLVSSLKGGKDVCWVLTHKDESTQTTPLSRPGYLPDVYAILKEWTPLCTRIVSKTPPDRLIDWKLIWQDPLPTWVSKGGRITLAGDSAHAFLPTSTQGATQALEDGVTIAVCLKMAGKARVREGLRAFQEIRYDRVCKVQETGKTTRERWHKADWDEIQRDPKKLELPREGWILDHDAEAYAKERCEETFGARLAETDGESRM